MNYFFVAITLILILFLFFRWQNNRPVKRTPKDISNILQSWLDDNIDWNEWDYFESCFIENEELEAIRQKCLEIDHFESEYLDLSEGKISVLNEKGREFVRDLLAQCSLVKESSNAIA